ncbi:aminoglycoside phosphotransferase family protein [Streptosporangium sp. NBC_01810]|uniref:phosphotransferase family protein n=1 Tax=Streptosporangium sp. NBC_01810 TaxID=2975951 RepID=UPI002DDB7FAC|nr:aminoglycoside phosphotransferase family protein [Streptosporangium sp. NBC_01810]WSA25416.1 aminoglycoside phosphotransferase family protein [Streptosporangium sp. NBC_01810]
MTTESVHDLLGDLSTRYGDWDAPVTKPYSLNYRNTAGNTILKIYRRITPVQRQRRETEALERAPAFGVKTPRVLEAGRLGRDAWTVITVIPGRPLTLSTPVDVEEYLHRVLELTQALAAQRSPVTPGDGWEEAHDARTTGDYLADMLSSRVRRTSWWPELRAKLADLDGEPLVYLHGDVKPEHILVEDAQAHVVDWEASARGPAIRDVADAMFHAARDLEYDGVEVRSFVSAFQAPALADRNVSPMLAWRVALWADRRRPLNVHRLSASLMAELLSTTTHEDACTVLLQIIRAMRLIGTPR